MATKKEMEEILNLLHELKEERKEFSLISHEEHDFLREIIDERKASKEAYQAIKIKLISGTLWAVFVAITAACVLELRHWLLSA